jgi:tRNA(His) 5'-end guanylyltransferase
MPRLPILARIDGKRFSKFTQGLKRPYDERLSRLMVATAQHLIAESAAVCGYTQSDEISLLFYEDDLKAQVFLDRRIQKLTSILASMTTGFFNAHLGRAIPEKADAVALFDCRVWAVPTKDEAANMFLWRELDATKNSVSMAARVYQSSAELHGKNNAEMHELLFQNGVNWNDYPPFFKRGTFILRRTIERPFTADELEALPPRHAARTNPALVVTRTELRAVELPPFSRVINRVGVLFDAEEPRLAPDHAP